MIAMHMLRENIPDKGESKHSPELYSRNSKRPWSGM
jgi:hypothetical protein